MRALKGSKPITTALNYLVGKAETTIVLDNRWEVDAIAVVNTIIISAPQVLLFIALALLAIQGLGEEISIATEPEMSWSNRILDWVRRAREWRGGPI